MGAKEEDMVDGEDEHMLINERQKSNKKRKYEEGGCRKYGKVVLAIIGVTLLISLGVIIGATTYNNRRHESSNNVPQEHKNIRLPTSLIPVKYKLQLHPNITDGKFLFDGDVRILVTANDNVDQIILHSKDLGIVNVEVLKGESGINLNNATKLGLKSYVEEKDKEFLKINLNEKLDIKHKYVIHITFKGSLSTGLEGFYRSSYKTKSGETRYLATTHFEATHARAAFPCFDEPAMKANFTIIIVHEKKHTALSNMPSKIVYPRDSDGLMVEEFQESVKMSTYLVAFVVCDYAYKEGITKNGVKVKVWAPEEQIEQANFARDTAIKVLDYYDDYFQVKFPLPKQDLIAIPDFGAGAMENWGLITYRLTSILYDEKESSSANKQWVAVVIAHELAHQWFGNLVTMKWWNDLWLNEGFAAFVEFIGANVTNPQWQMMDQFIVDDVQKSLQLDSHANSHPISVPVHDPAQINEIFDTISYDKGASIIRMMEMFLTTNVFHTGLTNYLKKYQFSNAVSDDLWACMTEAQTGENKVDVKSVMDTWTLQMGYPVVTIKRDRGKNESAVVTQHHFLSDVNANVKKSPFGYKWDVPLTYYENGNDVQMIWFNRSKTSIQIPWKRQSGWIKGNKDGVGFYHVNYDEENWDLLSKQLKEDHLKFSTSDRANLIADAFELAKANLLPQLKALNMTAYLSEEKEYVPWITALSSITYIGELLQGRNGYPYYEKYIVQQVAPMVKELGWEDTGSHLQKYLRGAVLRSSVAHNDSSSVNEALKRFRSWMINNETIPANLRSVIYLAGIKYGGQAEWDYMWKLYETTSYPSEQRQLMFSLTETTDATILKKYLSYTLDSTKIRSQDSCSVVEHIAMNPKGYQMALQYVKDNWDEFYKRYGTGSFDISSLIKTVFGRGKNHVALIDAENFLRNHQLGSGKLAGEQAIALIQNHLNWLGINEATVVEWFKKVDQSRSN